MKDLDTVLVAVARNGNVKFPLTDSTEVMGTPVDVLTLDRRSYNGLKRNHIDTIGELVTSITNGKLINLQGIGTKSVNRIIYELCVYEYNRCVTKEQKNAYLTQIVKLNYA